MPGIITSSRMRSGFSTAVAMASAFSPLVAILVRNESFNTPEITATLVGVSSTIKTRFLLGPDIIRLEVARSDRQCRADRLHHSVERMRKGLEHPVNILPCLDGDFDI